MTCRLGFLAVAGLLAASPTRVAHATPTCSLASLGDPCDGTATSRARSDLAPPSPWLDEGPPPPWMAPAATPDDGDHRVRSLAALGGIYGGIATWMYFAWYRDQPRLSGFTVGGDGYFGEDTYAGGVDKIGHAWANMWLARAGTELLRWGGWERRPAALISAGLAWSLFLFVEIKDGYYYQLSPGDMYANTLGAALAVAMTEWPALDRLIDFRVAYWPSPEYRSIIDGSFMGNTRINSVNIAEDYSGQTYFLALHLGALPRSIAPPSWMARFTDYVNVGVGFQATRYKPDPPDDPPYVRRQRLFLGATIDLQRVIDRGLGGRRNRAARITRKIGHGLTEVLSLPILPALSTSRSPDE